MRCVEHCILVIDFGSQYTQLLLRKIRKLRVYAELCRWDIPYSQLCAINPSGIIFSGGPHSVTEEHFPLVSKYIFDLGVPILGICYGMQIMTYQLGGIVQNSMLTQGEFGYSQVEIFSESVLINNIGDGVNIHGRLTLDTWMSHKDVVTFVPKGFTITGITKQLQIAIIENQEKQLYGVQFHPEVTHTKQGDKILDNFLMGICGCKPLWKPKNIIKDIVSNIRSIIGTDKVVLAFSGGVDSFVTAILLKYAIGDQFISIFINNGLLCGYEFHQINKFQKKYQDFNVVFVSEEKRFLNALIGIKDPEEKRKIIGKIFIKIFETQIKKLTNIKWLAQGTICSDIIESGMSVDASCSDMIKSHHNVGGLPDAMNIKLLEPIRHLFKDEVRSIGIDLGLPHDIVYRYPYPGPGLAIRIIGEVKEQYCSILRQADCIFIEELNKNNLYHNISQAFAVFLPIYSVGIQGDQRQYNWVIALRAIETIDFMTARWAYLPYDFLEKVSNRIINEVKDVSRVVYDISCKPPSTIEWE